MLDTHQSRDGVPARRFGNAILARDHREPFRRGHFA